MSGVLQPMTESLLDQALAAQLARNAAALDAIRARADDIGEAQRLVTALTARAFTIRAIVDVDPFHTPAACRIRLWATASRDEWKRMREWIDSQSIAIARLEQFDAADVKAYELTLRGGKHRLNVTLRDPRITLPRPVTLHPEAA